MNLREIFKNDVSKSAFKVVDGVTRIIGKNGEIEIIDDIFDIYFVGPDRTPLHGLTLSTIRKKLPLGATLIELTGEAYLRTTSEELARLCLPLLKVKKKRQLSDTEKDRLRRMVNKRVDGGNEEY